MSDILGPASAENAVTTRPSETRTFSSLDTWFEDCSSPTAGDGTEVQASWLNGMLAALRSFWRMNGALADGTAKIVPEVGSDDDGLTKSVQQLVQRGQPVFAVDTGARNHLVVTLAPALREYKAGAALRVLAKFSNDGPADIVVNGLAPRAIRRPTLQALSANDIPASGVIEICDDGAQFQLISAGAGAVTGVPLGNPTLYVRTDGNDTTGDGSANTAAKAFATIQGALTYAQNVWSLGGKKLFIQLGNPGAYTGFVNVANPVTGITITGDPGNPGSYVILAPSGVSGFSQVVSAQGASLALVGVTVSTNGRTDIQGIQASYDAFISLSYVVVASTATTPFYALCATQGGSISVAGPITVNGSWGAAFMMQGGGNIAVQTGATATLGGGSFSTGVIYAAGSGASFTLIGRLAGTASGNSYYVIVNASVQSFGGFIPGSGSGVVNSGGQFS